MIETKYECIIESELLTPKKARACPIYSEGKCEESDSGLCSIEESERIWNQD